MTTATFHAVLPLAVESKLVAKQRRVNLLDADDNHVAVVFGETTAEAEADAAHLAACANAHEALLAALEGMVQDPVLHAHLAAHAPAMLQRTQAALALARVPPALRKAA